MRVCCFLNVCECVSVRALGRITSVYKSAVESKHGDLMQKLCFVRVPARVVSKHSRRPSATVVKSDPLVKHQYDPLFAKITIIVS